LKTENIEMKDHERAYKLRVKELEGEIRQLKERAIVAERYTEDLLNAAQVRQTAL
jgi:predicted transcriptional regulator